MAHECDLFSKQRDHMPVGLGPFLLCFLWLFPRFKVNGVTCLCMLSTAVGDLALFL